MQSIFVLLTSILVLSSCSTHQNKLTNFDLNLYERTRNASPYCGVFDKVSNSFIVLGRNVSGIDGQSCTLTEISKDGEILKEYSFGTKSNRLNKLYITPGDRIIMSGTNFDSRNLHTWIVEVDRDFNVILDTTLDKTGGESPSLFFSENETVLMERTKKGIEISKLDARFGKKSTSIIEHPYKNNGANFMSDIKGYCTDGNIVFTGSAAPFVEENSNLYNYDVYVYCYSIANDEILWKNHIGNDTKYLTSDCILQKEKFTYVAGIERNNDGDSLDFFNAIVYKFDQKGNLLEGIIDSTSIPDYTHALAIYNDDVLVAGTSFLRGRASYNGEMVDIAIDTVMLKSLHKNKLQDIDLFSKYTNLEKIKFISNIGDNKLLILGTGRNNRRWRVIVADDND